MPIGSFTSDRRRASCDLPRGRGGRRRTDSPQQSRALVEYAPRAETTGARAGAPRYAPFLAHLIATAGGFPQTRSRRRADPATGAFAYARNVEPTAQVLRDRSV